MTEQFDFISGKFEKIKGMTRALNAAKAWQSNADEYLSKLPSGAEFSGDDLRRECGIVHTGPNNNNAVGAWFSARRKAGLIVWTGRFRQSLAVNRRTGMQRIWMKK